MIANSDYELTWPRDLLRAELTMMIDGPAPARDWRARAQLLLEDAFSSTVPRDDFENPPLSTDPWDTSPMSQRQFLVELRDNLDSLRTAADRPLYWTERRSGQVSRSSLALPAITRGFSQIIENFVERGYYEQAFQKDCVDEPSLSLVNPSNMIERLTGRPDLWPLNHQELSEDLDAFCDAVEVLHDLVSRPRRRWLHDYMQCGWHYADFARGSGQALYRWRVNALLEQSDLGLRLADDGEDTGRLIEVTDDARTDLVKQMVRRDDGATGDRIRHAIAQFRARSADEHDKRSAAMTLALVLEERRALLKEELHSRDEGDLFMIANKFAIRHQNDHQQQDYDPAFRDWIFWWYLATIELTDRLIERASRQQP